MDANSALAFPRKGVLLGAANQLLFDAHLKAEPRHAAEAPLTSCWADDVASISPASRATRVVRPGFDPALPSRWIAPPSAAAAAVPGERIVRVARTISGQQSSGGHNMPHSVLKERSYLQV
eukprot:SAG22_NODE_2362_length_2658_cov_2.917937_2_plen_121_part_00